MARENKNPDAGPGVVEQLQEDILAERYRPGEWLKQADLESRYRANRFEVRMALSALAARHLIDHIPNRGYRVINPSDRERAELYEVRIILETAAGRLAAQRASENDINELTRLVDEFEDAIENGSLDDLRKLNFAFHSRFNDICGNKMLAEQVRELRERGLPGRSGGWDTVAGMRASNEDHRKMIEMLRQRDTEGLGYIIYRHLNRWREFSKPATR